MPYQTLVTAFCSANHRLSQRRSIAIAELQGERLILRESGSTMRTAIETQPMRCLAVNDGCRPKHSAGCRRQLTATGAKR